MIQSTQTQECFIIVLIYKKRNTTNKLMKQVVTENGIEETENKDDQVKRES